MKNLVYQDKSGVINKFSRNYFSIYAFLGNPQLLIITRPVSNTGKGINQDSFKLGVLFVLSELEKGRKKGQILKDKRISELEVGELVRSEEDAARISQRFGIA